MALFGTEMVDVTTPDGRRVTLPAQLAANFPGLTPVAGPGPAAPPAPALPPIPPESAPPAAGALPVAAPAPPEQPAPPTAASTPRPEPVRPAPAPPPVVPRPLNAVQAARVGSADVYNAEQRAIDQQTEAARELGRVDADQATAVGNAMAARDAETQRILEERNAQAQRNQQEIDSKMMAYEQEAKAIKDTKIDRKADHPIWAAIGVAVSGLGSALKKESGNAALDALYKAIDRKVAGQMADLDLRRAGLATQRDAIGMAREQGKDRLAEIDVRRVAAIDQAAQQIESLKTRLGSDRAKANADLAIAGLAEERAKSLGNLADRETAKQNHRDSIGLQRAGLAQGDRHFNLRLAEDQRQFDIREKNDLLAAQMAAAAKGGKNSEAYQKALKENEERGIRDPATGEYLLQPEGQAIVEQSKKLEASAERFRAEAAKQTDPNKKQMMLTRAEAEAAKASEMRGQAILDHAVRGRSSGAANELGKLVSDTQSAVSLIDEITNIRAKYGPNWIVETAKDKEMQTKKTALELQIKEAYQLGAIDKGSKEYLDRMTGGNPSAVTPGDITSFLNAAAGSTASLNALADSIIQRTRNQLSQSMKDASRWSPRRDKPTPQDETVTEAFYGDTGKTPAELAAGEERGVVGKAIERFFYPLGEQPAERAAQKQIEAGDARFPTLTKKQADAVQTHLRAYKANSSSGKPELAEKSAEILVGLAGNSDRPHLQRAMLDVLKTEAPDLAERALAKLPDSVREAARKDTAAVMPQPIGLIRDNALKGDQQATAELARRAAQGDKEAIRAAGEVVRARQGFRPREAR